MSRITNVALKCAPRIIKDYFKWMNKYSKHPEKYPIKERYFQLVSLTRFVMNKLKIEVISEGLENLPKEASLIVSNHLSSADPLPFFQVIDEPCTFLAKVEIEKFPFVPKCIKSIGGLFLDRDNLKQSLKTMMKIQDDLTVGEKHWIIFAEGTRNKDPLKNMKEFHHGTFRPAVKAKRPIVPAALYGTFRMIKSKPVFNSYPVHIKFLKPIYYEEYKDLTTEQIAKMVNERIQREVSYSLRQLDHKKMTNDSAQTYNIYNII